MLNIMKPMERTISFALLSSMYVNDASIARPSFIITRPQNVAGWYGRTDDEILVDNV